LGCFFFFRVFSGSLAIVSQFVLLCSSNVALNSTAQLVFLTATGICMLFICCILSHRYLLVKAEVMCSVSGNSNRSSKSSVKKREISTVKALAEEVKNMTLTLDVLNWSFKWEARSVGILMPVGMVLYVLGFEQPALVMGAVSIVTIFLLDGTFSVMVTYVFLQVCDVNRVCIVCYVQWGGH
jgi:hypothetical protein